ncbi:MAG: Ca2+:H+ antiporter [Solirubrobacteraceae bacterium]|jgi:Ca2+:H+ antiporter|nr:Ca2+:H+ antiporter [Solirubrobacteraceae bacterium]
MLAAFTARQRTALIAIGALSVAGGAMHYAGVSGLAVFPVVTVALGGLAWMVALGTDALGAHFGPGVTGVLQSTLGNLPELFVVIFALNAGDIVVAQTSLLGSLFANALLVMGMVIVAGARASPDGVMRFERRLPNDTATLMLLAVFIIVLLGVSVSTHDRASAHKVAISAAGAVVLLGVYFTWLYSYLRADERGESGADEAQAGDADGGDPHAPPPLSLRGALGLLAAAGVGAAFISDWFVAALNPAIHALHLSKAFAGLVIVAIAGNAVENFAGISLAAKGKMDDAVSVVKNSVAQIAVFLFPVLVLVSLLFATPLTFVLAPVYIGALLITALVLWQVTGDGEATIPEGAALIGIYLMLAFLTFFE